MRGLRPFTSVTLAAAFLATAWLGAGCSNSTGSRDGQTVNPGPTSKPMHSVQVRQLKGLMQVISHTATTRWPKTMPTDVEQPVDTSAQQRAYDEAAMLADSLVIAASQIPAVVDAKTLPDEIRTGFLSEARMLKDQAVQLKVNATQKRAESMERTLDAINTTCINCHSKYRDLSGNIDIRRADGHRGWELLSAR
jgi:hypothetical protein